MGQCIYQTVYSLFINEHIFFFWLLIDILLSLNTFLFQGKLLNSRMHAIQANPPFPTFLHEKHKQKPKKTSSFSSKQKGFECKQLKSESNGNEPSWKLLPKALFFSAVIRHAIHQKFSHRQKSFVHFCINVKKEAFIPFLKSLMSAISWVRQLLFKSCF